MRRMSLTSWTTHRFLTGAMTPAFSLPELPAKAHAAGITTLEICHFHIGDTSTVALTELREAIKAADVELFSILIDTGDISNADSVRRQNDMHIIEGWIDCAATLGAQHVRVVAGESAPDDQAALQRSIEALSMLSEYARQRSVRVLTENFQKMASTAENCQKIIRALDGAVGLCADIGNFAPATRIQSFRQVIDLAESIHVKGSYAADGQLDSEELRACLDASLAVDFTGPYTLVYDKPDKTWEGVAQLAEVVKPYTAT